MKFKLCAIGFFFCLIAAIGAINISDTQKPVPLPIDGAFSIQGKSNLSNNEIYKTISNLSKMKKVAIYKPIVQDSGQVAYLNVADTNSDQLKSVPITGMYYTLGKIDATSLKLLKATGLQTVYMAYPWYIGGMLPFTGTLRLLLMLSLYLTLLVVLVVVRMRQIKEGVIRRSLGLPVCNLRKDYVSSFTLELVMVAVLMIFYSHFWGSGLFTYSSKLVFSMLLTNVILFQIIDLISFVLFWLTIKVEKPIEIIKNKAKNKLIFVIWLVIISTIIIVSGIFLQETNYIPHKYKENKKSIENTVVAEQFTGTNYTKENLAVQIIPNGKKLFYFNENGTTIRKTKTPLPLASAADSTDNIVVVLDTDK